VVVLGLTQDVRALDPTVATLLDDSIELDIPTPEERCSILQACAENHQMTGQQDFAHALKEVSLKCHGYLPADLNALCTRAAVIAHGHGRTLNSCTKQDFYSGMKAIRVSALRQNTSVQKVDPVYWNDIGGLEHVKVTRHISISLYVHFLLLVFSHIVNDFLLTAVVNMKKTLEESVIWLYKHAKAYSRMGVSPSKGVLL
jgi:SpoVK/Ycf46/Vps4 family AAA+-type ATPase